MEMVVEVADVTAANTELNSVRSFATTSKFAPEIVVAVPGAPIVGVKLEMEGAFGVDVVTVKEVELVAVPLDVVTVIGPVVAPVGTVATI